MLYLEDYMEMIENLPMEMRDHFTEMREMDLEVQNGMDSLEERLKNFFKECGTTPNLKQDCKDETFKKIKEDYHKMLEQADEKVQLTTTIHDLFERYLRKLDQEVLKFKLELEADNMGITEVLEKRSLELDQPTPSPPNHRTGEKRKYSSMLSHHLEKRRNLGTQQSPDTLKSSLAETLTRSSSVAMATAASPAAVTSIFSPATSASTPVLSYNLGPVGAGSDGAIAAVASRAIGATLEMQQGRRTVSLKASYEAVMRQQSGFSKEFATFAVQSASSSFGGAVVLSSGETLPPPPPPATKSSSSRHKKSRARQQALKLQREREAESAATTQLAAASVSTAAVSGSNTTAAAGDASATGGDNMSNSWQVDPNEPRYCICNVVSYGDMVGCDNRDCAIEWFHYPCVGLNQAPKGKWYCPQCAAAMKRRGRK